MTKISITEFLSTIIPDENEPIYFRSIAPKGIDNIYSKTFTTTTGTLSSDTKLRKELKEANKHSGIYFVVNSGGKTDKEIKRYNAFFVENDDLPIAEQHQLLEVAPIPPSIRIETKKSVHAYWLIDGDCSETEWREIQAVLIAYFDGDKKIKNPSRCMRVPHFQHLSFDEETRQYGLKQIKITDFRPEKRFSVEVMKQAFSQSETKAEPETGSAFDVTSVTGVTSDYTKEIFSTWDELNAELGRRIMDEAKRNSRGKYEMRCPVHVGKSDTSLFFDPESKKMKCLAGCSHVQILEAFGLPSEPQVAGRKDKEANGKEANEAEIQDGKSSLAAMLVSLMGDAELFTSQNDEPFASVRVNGHIENWAIESKTFRNWLGRRFYEAHQKIASENAVKEALATLCGKAKFDGQQKQVYIRRAEFGGAVYLDLVNDDWQVVRVTSEGWEIISDCPVKFRRSRGMKPLPLPVRGGSLNQLNKFLNIYGDDLVLVKAWLITTLKADIPYPILVFASQQNCGKSTSANVLCKMVDPNLAELVSKPRSEEDLFVSVTNRLVVAIDNLSYISDTFSDSLCRIATGGAFTKRKNYSDYDETILIAKNPLIITGIGDIATRGDLLSRSIIIHLPTITERASETDFWKDFTDAQPKILGALLDLISEGLRNFSDVEVENCEARMLDFVKFGTAVEKSLGLEKGGFVALCNKNYENANKIALENNPVAIIIFQFMQNRKEWVGTASELLAEIFMYSDEVTKRNPLFPQNPQRLSNILDRLAPGFLLEGINIDKGDHLRESGTGNRRIKIIKTGNTSSHSSHSSQITKAVNSSSHSSQNQNTAPRRFYSQTGFQNMRNENQQISRRRHLSARKMCAGGNPLAANWQREI
jgi:hypothetical protein